MKGKPSGSNMAFSKKSTGNKSGQGILSRYSTTKSFPATWFCSILLKKIPSAMLKPPISMDKPILRPNMPLSMVLFSTLTSLTYWKGFWTWKGPAAICTSLMEELSC